MFFMQQERKKSKVFNEVVPCEAANEAVKPCTANDRENKKDTQSKPLV